MKSQNSYHSDAISCGKANTLPELFGIRANTTPDAFAYRQYNPKNKLWLSYTWHDAAALAGRWQHALSKENLARGDRVAVLLRNCLEWVCFDQAALSLGLVVVPLYTSDTPENIAYILADSGAKLLLVGNIQQWKKLVPLQAQLPSLLRVLCLQTDTADLNILNEKHPDQILRFVEKWLPRESYPFQVNISEPDALATIVYTSGTTGRPKGVMLTHRNILWNTGAALQAFQVNPDDVFLSFLPLSHMFERTAGYYLPMMAGSCVAYARSMQELGEDLITQHPTILIAVPRVFERVYGRIKKQLQDKGWLAHRLFCLTEKIGWQRFEAAQGHEKYSILSALLWPLLQNLVAKRVLSRFGGCLRVAVSGGAPLYGQISQALIGLGLPLIQGYGMTEASPVISANRFDNNIPDSVGEALNGVELHIEENNELWVRSPGVMSGYWNRPEDTRIAIDDKGWLHTGDQAEIIGNHLFIRGRIKEILVTSSGEKVPPADMEMAICQDPLFDLAMVIGEGKPYLATILVLNAESWRKLATELQIDPEDPSSLGSQRAIKPVLEKVKLATQNFPGHARIRAIHLTLEPWTIENGLITPTLKLKRPEIECRFAAVISQLYAKHDVIR